MDEYKVTVTFDNFDVGDIRKLITYLLDKYDMLEYTLRFELIGVRQRIMSSSIKDEVIDDESSAKA